MIDVTPDPKATPRIIDRDLTRRLHIRWRECALCGKAASQRSLHHIHRHPRDDVEGNLVMCCGHGTAGCHGNIEARHAPTLQRLRDHIELARPDVIEYLDAKLGGLDHALAWLDRYVAPVAA